MGVGDDLSGDGVGEQDLERAELLCRWMIGRLLNYFWRLGGCMFNLFCIFAKINRGVISYRFFCNKHIIYGFYYCYLDYGLGV